jgi:superfamily II DNA helicase RecQ
VSSLPKCLNGAYLGGNQTREATAKVLASLAAGELDLLYVAPERLMVARFVRLLQRVTVPLVAIDEAHCVALWSHNFRPAYMRLRRILHRVVRVPTVLALTATATRDTQRNLCRALGLRVVRDVVIVDGQPDVERAGTSWYADDANIDTAHVDNAADRDDELTLLQHVPREQWSDAQVVRQPAVRRNLHLHASRSPDRHAALLALLGEGGALQNAKAVIVYATMKVCQ